VPSVLFLCTGNSCRSILAEALWREETAGTWHCASAGTHPAASPHPLAIAVLKEDQIPVDELQSQAMEDLNSQQFDLAVTVCDAAHQHCPVFANATRTLHWPFPDPATHSEVGDTTQLGLDVFRTARDAIRKRIQRHLLASDLIDRLDHIIEQLPREIPEERRLAYSDLIRRCAGALDEGHP
jgi:arsenate reductase